VHQPGNSFQIHREFIAACSHWAREGFYGALSQRRAGKELSGVTEQK
jgi:hypothetical protein